jgi:hypothetical protein
MSTLTDNLPKILNMIPIIVPISLMFNSIMNASLRGFFYTFGSIITLLFNNILSGIISPAFKKEMSPFGSSDETGIKCNEGLGGMFETNPFPDPISTFMSFTTSYVAIAPVFINPYVNQVGKGFWALTQLLFLSLLIAFVRVKSCCSSWISVFSGWVMGLIIGLVWYSTVGYLSRYEAGFTYFENTNKKKCKINGNSYTCSND